MAQEVQQQLPSVEDIKSIHQESLKEMTKDVDDMEKALGPDNTALLKMRSILNTMSSFTSEELIDVYKSMGL